MFISNKKVQNQCSRFLLFKKTNKQKTLKKKSKIRLKKIGEKKERKRKFNKIGTGKKEKQKYH